MSRPLPNDRDVRAWVPLVLGATVLLAALVLADRHGVASWAMSGATEAGGAALSRLTETGSGSPVHPLVELAKLIGAALMGWLVTGVQRQTGGHRLGSRSMEQAQILLCVSGALMMIIIGNSLARAFGIAGAASIVRFRTPVDDPRDVTILFILMGLGMAVGLGAFAVGGLGALFLCACLILLRSFEDESRVMRMAVVAEGRFPVEHVQQVCAAHDIALEQLEILHGETTTVRYRARFAPTAPLEAVSAALIDNGRAAIKSVSWEVLKKSA